MVDGHGGRCEGSGGGKGEKSGRIRCWESTWRDSSAGPPEMSHSQRSAGPSLWSSVWAHHGRHWQPNQRRLCDTAMLANYLTPRPTEREIGGRPFLPHSRFGFTSEVRPPGILPPPSSCNKSSRSEDLFTCIRGPGEEDALVIV
jgi:hypothetical protein